MDPLQHRAADQDELERELERALASSQINRRDSNDGALDLGDSGLDRFRTLDMYADEGRSTAAHPPDVTYGQLVAPPSYEDSLSHASAHQHFLGGPLSQFGPPAGLHEGHDTDVQAGPSSTSEMGKGTGGAGVSAQGHSNGTAAATQAGQLQAGGTRGKEQLMAITVTDPVKRENALSIFNLKGGYVVYLVTTQLHAELPGYPPGARQVTARRRFRDFMSLHDMLKVRFRGYFLPPRPEKNNMEGQARGLADAFVEERRTGLEKYLNRLAAHPVVARSEEFRLFLTLEGELESSPAWNSAAPPAPANLMESTALLSKQLLGLEKSVLDPVQATQPTKKSADLLRAFKETAQSMHSTGTPGSSVPMTDTEAGLRREKERLEGVRDALWNVTKAAERFVHRMDRLASAQGDAGLTLFKLAKFEEADGPHLAQYTGTVRQSQALSAGNKLTATSLVRSSRVMRKGIGRAATELSVLHEHLAAMPPAIKGLSAREKQLLTTDTLAADLAARQRSIRDLEAATGKTLGGDASKARKIDDLRNDVAKLECSISAARAEYDRITGINQQELSRLKSEYGHDMLGMAAALAASQALTEQRAAEVWLQLAAELGASREDLSGARGAALAAQGLQSHQQQQHDHHQASTSACPSHLGSSAPAAAGSSAGGSGPSQLAYAYHGGISTPSVAGTSTGGGAAGVQGYGVQQQPASGAAGYSAGGVRSSRPSSGGYSPLEPQQQQPQQRWDPFLGDAGAAAGVAGGHGSSGGGPLGASGGETTIDLL